MSRLNSTAVVTSIFAMALGFGCSTDSGAESDESDTSSSNGEGASGNASGETETATGGDTPMNSAGATSSGGTRSGDDGEEDAPPPVPDGDGWTYCASQDEQCEFNELMEVAIGNGEGFVTNTHIDGVACSGEFFGPAPTGGALHCYVRPIESDCVLLRSVDEFRDALAQSDQCFRLKAGVYTVTELHEDKVTVMYAEGNNSTFDLTGATIITPVKLLSEMNRNPIHAHAAYKLHGNGLTFINGTFENTYPAGMSDDIDFTTYNANPELHPARQMTEFRVAGNNTTFQGTRIIVRGSAPYGYGDMFGKGQGAVEFLKKHAAIQVSGDGTLFDGVYVKVAAFGHGIFMQGADNTTIVNSMVEGEVRLGADMYEDGEGSLGAKWNYEQQSPDWYLGVPIDKERMYNLTEDGIRAYTRGTKLDGSEPNTGSITVKNTVVKNMRGCITTSLASGQILVEDSTIEGCSAGYTLANGGIIRNSRGDASYGPLYNSDYSHRHTAEVELELLDGPPTTGSHPMMHIAGRGHEFTLTYNGNKTDGFRTISIGNTGDRWAGQADENAASNIEFTNLTPSPMHLTEFSSDISGTSEGAVTDDGTDNTVSASN